VEVEYDDLGDNSLEEVVEAVVLVRPVLCTQMTSYFS